MTQLAFCFLAFFCFVFGLSLPAMAFVLLAVFWENDK